MLVNATEQMIKRERSKKDEFFKRHRKKFEDGQTPKNYDDSAKTPSTSKHSAIEENSLRRFEESLKVPTKFEETLKVPTKFEENLKPQNQKMEEVSKISSKIDEDLKNSNFKIKGILKIPKIVPMPTETRIPKLSIPKF